MNPMAVKPWTVTASRYLLKDKWLAVRADQCQTARGVMVDPYYVLEYPDWVQVVAFDADSRILVTRQYRHAAGSVCLELPCGVVEKTDETPLAAAKRELMEETGCTSDHFEFVGQFSPNPATHTNTLHCFVAYDVSRSQADKPGRDRGRFLRLPNNRGHSGRSGNRPILSGAAHLLTASQLKAYRHDGPQRQDE